MTPRPVRELSDGTLASTARVLGREFARTGEAGEYFLARLADEVARYDLVEGEYRRRRFVADDLAHADERNPRFSHWVEPR